MILQNHQIKKTVVTVLHP